MRSVLTRRPPGLALSVVVVAVSIYFATAESANHVYIYDTVLLACIGALALQVLQGTAGLLSVGTAGFLMAGAFGTIWAQRAGIPFPLDICFGAVLAGVLGAISGLPALRLKALFLALATLAAHFIILFVATLYQGHVNAAQSNGFTAPVLFSSKGLRGEGRDWTWLLAGVVVLVILASTRVMSGRAGRALRMIREHEHVAPTLGISVQRYKLQIFALSSLVIGMEGGLLAYFTGNVSTDSFDVSLAFQYIAMIIIGGSDSVAGAVAGAAIVMALPSVTPGLVSLFVGSGRGAADGPGLSQIIYGVLVVLCVTMSPGGLVGLTRDLRQRLMRLRVLSTRFNPPEADAEPRLDLHGQSVGKVLVFHADGSGSE